MRINLKNHTGKVFVTSDLHLNHANIIKYSNRPFNSVHEMNDTIINNWNSVVGNEDIVINLGDFSFTNDINTVQFLEQLKGIQYFIFGNHDKVMHSDRVKGYCKRTGKITMFCDTLEMNYNGNFIFMSHYAHRTWNRSHRGSLHLYGHSHGTLPGIGRSMDVGVDSNDMISNFTPFFLDDVVKFLNLQQISEVL